MRAVLVRYGYADLQLRAEHREAHVTRLRSLAADGVVLLAGPNDAARGAVVVLAVDDEDAAREVMDADVYLTSGAVVAYTAEAFDAVVTAPALDSDA